MGSSLLRSLGRTTERSAMRVSARFEMPAGAQESDGQNRDPQHGGVDVDALPKPHPRRGQVCLKLGLVQTCQNAKHDEYQHSRDRIEAEPLSECRSPETHGEQVAESTTKRENSVPGIGSRALARCQCLAQMHRGK